MAFANKVLVLVSLAFYVCAMISPATFWPAGFAALLIMPCVFLHVGFVLFWAWQRRKQVIYSLFALLVGIKFVWGTFAFHPFSRPRGDFSVLSYNVQVLRVYADFKQDADYPVTQKMVRWVTEEEADIKCFQEFYSRKEDKRFNLDARLRKTHPHAFFWVTLRNRISKSDEERFGLAIFSRYPIVAKGQISFDHHTMPGNRHGNAAIYADVRIGRDTVRIICTHLESMAIREEEMNRSKSRSIARRMRSGMIARAHQTEQLLDFIQKSPYRVVLTGDFNEPPYSSAYLRFGRHLSSAFEEAGTGFDFSYNGKLFFLRIDHQFYSQGLEAKHFETLRQASYTDHFPIKGHYEIKSK